LVSNLPMHVPVPGNQWSPATKGPTEVPVDERVQSLLHHHGLVALLNIRNSHEAVFFSAPTVHCPRVYASPEATSSAAEGSQLPCVIVVSRLMQYIKTLSLNLRPRCAGPLDLQEQLGAWIMRYVRGEAGNPAIGRTYPIQEAVVQVIEDLGNPGLTTVVTEFRVTPGMYSASVRVVMHLGSDAG
jgi:predicted component of type VI protein secretion system